MSDVFTAVRSRWLADAAIVAAVPGGLYLAQAPPKDGAGRPIERPYAVLVDLGNSFEWTSGTPYIDSHGIQISIFSTTQAEGETARAALRSSFDAVKISIDGSASCIMCLPEAEETTREDNNIWHTRVDYMIKVHRSL
ncbi:hypothetical protein LCGC14_0685900 [marine sediment metagenome]|uniref:DUF3168 domain-containing protein n=1 Tax=marine sediment metagenome TaxID=412755 RepID=A0A0F9R747_9ZZZZ